jgi:CheY-like chemotaxis protein/HPt (histidine-containing phosphotransfer) domain-containing protein
MTIINDILDFSKIEAGRLEIEAVDFALWDMVGDTMKSLALRAHSKGLELAYHIDQEIPEMLVGDPIRLRQIIINLVGNAIKFTERGEVLVDVSCVAQNEGGLRLRFSVTDTGIGVSPDKQRLIFDAFSQADNSITRRFGGTGLGLSISSRLVSLMGGELELQSEEEHGSTFSFALWFARSEFRAAPSIHVQPDLLRNKDVLIVDDNATNRRILEEMVRSWGMHPLLAFSASDALQQLHQRANSGKPIPLLLTDVHMPEMDGLTLVEQIRGISQYSHLPVIVLSSGDRRIESDRCTRLAVKAHLTKPVKQSELLTAIEDALSPVRPAIDPHSKETATIVSEIAPLRVLLAEDGFTNQKLATALLTKWGHQVTVASNGREAVQAYQSRTFDLVLMDVQMPEMDGFEATAAIRALEKNTNRHIPIVAMTARAMQGDREHCLAAGMDGYVAKPIRQRDLYQEIVRFFAATALVAPPPLVVDWLAVLMEVENDREVLAELIHIFLEESSRLLAEMARGVQTADAQVVRHEAHKLKSSLQIFGARSLVELAERIEAQGRSGQLQGIGTAMETLQSQMKELRKALLAYLADPLKE